MPSWNTESGPFARFVGYRKGEDLADHYAAADLFAFASRTETFGNVVLEAMASGLPVVGLRAGGVAETVQSGTTGFLVDPAGPPSHMADALLSLIDQPDAAAPDGRGRASLCTEPELGCDHGRAQVPLSPARRCRRRSVPSPPARQAASRPPRSTDGCLTATPGAPLDRVSTGAGPSPALSGLFDEVECECPPAELPRVDRLAADDLMYRAKVSEGEGIGEKAERGRGFPEPLSQPAPSHGDDLGVIECQGRKVVDGEPTNIGRIRCSLRLQSIGTD